MINQISENQLDAAFELLQPLRPRLSREDFFRIYEQASKNDQYTLAGYFENERFVGLAGFRVLYDYVHLKHIYIDDLVVHPDYRRRGVGALLLDYVQQQAQALGCTRLRLCTGLDNQSAIRFYEKQGWESKTIVFKK